MAAVYAELPQATKDKLAGAELLHSGRYRYKIRPDNVGYDIFEILQAIDAFAPPVRHPAVIEHPYTKERVLYANSSARSLRALPHAGYARTPPGGRAR